jgi:hypothetical protein
MNNDYLEKYSPSSNIQQLLTQKIVISTDDDIFELWKKLVGVVRVNSASFLLIGKFLKTFRDQKLFETLDYESFAQFLGSEELSFSKEKAYMCIRTYEFYIEHLGLDPDEVGKMNVSRLSMMIPLLKDMNEVDAKDAIEDYQNLRHGDFVREVREKSLRNGKPEVYWAEEHQKWICSYYDDTTILRSLGSYEEAKKNQEAQTT